MNIRKMDHNQFAATYEITTPSGELYSAQKLWSLCMQHVRRCPFLGELSLSERQEWVAKYLNDHEWLKSYRGCVPSFVAKSLRDKAVWLFRAQN